MKDVSLKFGKNTDQKFLNHHDLKN